MPAIAAFACAVLGFAAPAGRLSPMARTPAPRMAKGNDAVSFPDLDGKTVRIGIIKARWHEDTCDSLVAGIKQAVAECDVPEENLVMSEVPGSFELPLAARYLALSGTVDAIIPVGILIKGAALPLPVRGARAVPHFLNFEQSKTINLGK